MEIYVTQLTHSTRLSLRSFFVGSSLWSWIHYPLYLEFELPINLVFKFQVWRMILLLKACSASKLMHFFSICRSWRRLPWHLFLLLCLLLPWPRLIQTCLIYLPCWGERHDFDSIVSNRILVPSCLVLLHVIFNIKCLIFLMVQALGCVWMDGIWFGFRFQITFIMGAFTLQKNTAINDGKLKTSLILTTVCSQTVVILNFQKTATVLLETIAILATIFVISSLKLVTVINNCC